MKRLILILFFVVLIVFAAAFTFLNMEASVVDFYFSSFKPPVAVLVFSSVLVGALLGVLVCFSRSFKRRSEFGKLRREFEQSQAELKNLRKIPIKDTR